MENSWETLGHKAVKTVLEKQLASGSLPHAYLFKGPEGSGKKALALEFAKKVLNSTGLDNHPDFISLGVEEKISVEEVRGLIAKLSVKPFVAKYTLAIIDNAHLLNQSASNALLKTLEEPSPTSVIIMVASGSVISTIASRCQSFVFNRVGDPVFAPEITGKVDLLESLHSSGIGERLASLKDFADSDTSELDQIFLAWLYRVKSRLAEDPAQFKLARSLIFAKNQLNTNVNKKFILQKLFLD